MFVTCKFSILTRRNASQGDYVSSHPGQIKNPVSAVRLAKVLPNVLSQMVWKLFTATQALVLRKDYAYAVIFPSDSQVHQTAVAWLGTIGFGFLYLCRIYFLWIHWLISYLHKTSEVLGKVTPQLHISALVHPSISSSRRFGNIQWESICSP